MKNKLYPIAASCMLILAILACNIPGGQSNSQPDLAATITAQALALESASGTPALLTTPLSTETPLSANQPASQNNNQPANTLIPQNNNQPADTPRPATPSKPKDFKAVGSATAIMFSWNDNSVNESGFRIYQDGVTAPVISVDAHPATGGMSSNWTGQVCGFKGKFTIRAFNDVGESGSSNSVNGVTIPCQPTNLIAHAQGNDISFNWAVTNPHNEEGFHIYQQGVPSAVASRGPNLGSGGTNYDLTGLVCNLVATYSVTAFNSAGESPASNLVQSETVPCGATGFTVTSITKDTVTYKWTDNATNETGYRVYRDDVLYVPLPAHAGTGAMNNDAAQQCDVNFPVTHVYAVRAFNSAGESNWSEHVGATTPVCP